MTTVQTPIGRKSKDAFLHQLSLKIQYSYKIVINLTRPRPTQISTQIVGDDAVLFVLSFYIPEKKQCQFLYQYILYFEMSYSIISGINPYVIIIANPNSPKKLQKLRNRFDPLTSTSSSTRKLSDWQILVDLHTVKKVGRNWRKSSNSINCIQKASKRRMVHRQLLYT